MDVAIFISRLLGPLFIVVAIGILLNMKHYQKVIEDFLKNTALIYLGGVMALLLGVLIILFYNVWVPRWTILVTIIGWLTILKGIFLIILPKQVIEWSRACVSNPAILTVQLIFVFSIGALFFMMGFFPGKFGL